MAGIQFYKANGYQVIEGPDFELRIALGINHDLMDSNGQVVGHAKTARKNPPELAPGLPTDPETVEAIKNAQRKIQGCCDPPPQTDDA